MPCVATAASGAAMCGSAEKRLPRTGAEAEGDDFGGYGVSAPGY